MSPTAAIDAVLAALPHCEPLAPSTNWYAVKTGARSWKVYRRGCPGIYVRVWENLATRTLSCTCRVDGCEHRAAVGELSEEDRRPALPVVDPDDDDPWGADRASL